jgi:hypothetical protein
MPTQTPTGWRNDARSTLALQQLRDAAGELDHLQAARDRALGVGQRLAVLGGDEPGQLVRVRLQQRLEREHDPGAANGRRRLPVGLSRPGRSHRAIDLARVGQRHLADALAERRVVDRPGAPAGAGHPLARHQMPDIRHVAASLVVSKDPAQAAASPACSDL